MISVLSLRFAGTPTIAQLAQIAASDLVTSIRVDCAAEYHID